MGRIADAGRPLALAPEGGCPVTEALALAILGLLACVVGDRAGAVQLARQAEQITGACTA